HYLHHLEEYSDDTEVEAGVLEAWLRAHAHDALRVCKPLVIVVVLSLAKPAAGSAIEEHTEAVAVVISTPAADMFEEALERKPRRDCLGETHDDRIGRAPHRCIVQVGYELEARRCLEP